VTAPGAPSPGLARSRRSAFAAGVVLLVLYALAVLSIGLTRDFVLLHEDNGAMQTTFALSHLRLGLARTRACNVFFEPGTGLLSPYAHHPPGTGLALAAAFAVTGSDAPAVARAVAIAFHVASIFVMVAVLSRLVPAHVALLGGAVMATLPMGAYFGRMVNFEPLCLLGITLQLLGYVRMKQDSPARGLPVLVAGIALGGVIDWASFFFTAAIAMAIAVDDLGERPRQPWALSVVAIAAAGLFALEVIQPWYAEPGSLLPLGEVAMRPPSLGSMPSEALAFVASQLLTAQRYYTDAGLVSALAVAAAMIAPRSCLGARVLGVGDPALVHRLAAISSGAAAAYVLAAPSWARLHAYWQFYALPYVVLSMVLVGWSLWRAAAGRGRIIARALLVILALDAAIGSASTLIFRHTSPNPAAVRRTADLRARFLAPTRAPGG